jgi:hypothetical protein
MTVTVPQEDKWKKYEREIERVMEASAGEVDEKVNQFVKELRGMDPTA